MDAVGAETPPPAEEEEEDDDDEPESAEAGEKPLDGRVKGVFLFKWILFTSSLNIITFRLKKITSVGQ